MSSPRRRPGGADAAGTAPWQATQAIPFSTLVTLKSAPSFTVALLPSDFVTCTS
jgi:hypothetical protein